MRLIILAFIAVSFTGCANIMKSKEQPVKFVGGLEKGSTKISLPDGNRELIDGSGTLLMTRSKDDIPIKVTCNGVTKEGVMRTSFDWAWGGLGNAVFGGIVGWVVDPLTPAGYNIQTPYNVESLCHAPEAPTVTAR